MTIVSFTDYRLKKIYDNSILYFNQLKFNGIKPFISAAEFKEYDFHQFWQYQFYSISVPLSVYRLVDRSIKQSHVPSKNPKQRLYGDLLSATPQLTHFTAGRDIHGCFRLLGTLPYSRRI